MSNTLWKCVGHTHGTQVLVYLFLVVVVKAYPGASGDQTCALLEAASAGDRESVRALLWQGVGVNACDEHQRTALFHAANRGHEVIVELLLQYGARLHSASRRVPLLAAINGRYLAIVTLLISYGARVNVVNCYKEGPLHTALETGHQPIIKVLLEAGADPNRQNGLGNTPLELAFAGCDEQSAMLLVRYGANIHRRDARKRTLLHRAAEMGLHRLVALLLERGADPNAKDKAGVTPGLLAVRNNRIDALHALLHAGALIPIEEVTFETISAIHARYQD